MSDEEQARIRHFEIIKHLHAAQISGKRYLNYADLEANLHLDRGSVANSLSVLQSLGYVRTSNLAAVLEKKAINVMENYRPKNFQEFVSKYNNPEKIFGEAGPKIEGYKGSFWDNHPILKIITPIGSVASIAGLILYLIFN